MKLEEEIKQTKFRNEFHKLAVNIIYSNSWVTKKHIIIMKDFNITPAQFNILRILRGQYPNPATVNLLKERMLDKMSDASRLVDRLVEKKLAERNVCPNDRRKVDVLITEKGLELLREIDSLNDALDAIFSNLSEDEAKTLNELLDKMRG
ncbi:MarR family winged helix-turn-helix transcriptional regulator [Melioribacteraceae bacterium 4301-Me]|uniref:MarR family winged helix-turn-helix transcriptional regulator n=1 Tax=Pyranulibacter aquaticus TaxID=3163344 RepID=UPI00359A02AD